MRAPVLTPMPCIEHPLDLRPTFHDGRSFADVFALLRPATAGDIHRIGRLPTSCLTPATTNTLRECVYTWAAPSRQHAAPRGRAGRHVGQAVTRRTPGS